MNRRNALQLITAAALTNTVGAPSMTVSSSWVGSHDARSPLPPADEAFLDDMQRRACLYFLEQTSATNGQVLDRAAASNTTGQRDPHTMASIAATGFGLSALCIADQRGYFPHQRLLDRVRTTLRYHLNELQHDHGFLYHFNDVDTGKPWRDTEVSSIDTALFLCGALTARAHFHTDPEIVALATELYNRVDWPYMLNGGPTFSMGLRGGKFLDARWSHFCELMMIYLLALGSPTHPVDAAAWDAWTRPTITYDGITYIGSSDPIFTHQYSHAWFDFRGKRDRYADYFTNSITATRAHKAFCLALGRPYNEDYWGISASDSQHGYTAWGGPSAAPRPVSSAAAATGLNAAALARSFGRVDGSVVPNATAGSLPFLPDDCLRVLRSLKERYPQSYGRYGFCDAFHPQANWYDADVLGIDLGIGLLMSENLRTGFAWKTFSRNPEVAVAFRKAGFHAA